MKVYRSKKLSKDGLKIVDSVVIYRYNGDLITSLNFDGKLDFSYELWLDSTPEDIIKRITRKDKKHAGRYTIAEKFVINEVKKYCFCKE